MKSLHHGEYVHLDVLPNGDLRVTLTPEGIEIDIISGIEERIGFTMFQRGPIKTLT